MDVMMEERFDKIIKFNLSGKFAHFRKFYTNSSALSYLIPPKTVIMGIIASILEYDRDQYYDLFDKKIGITVSVKAGCDIKKTIYSLNNMHDKYYKLCDELFKKGDSKKKIIHKGCKTELLSAQNSKNIEYEIYLGCKKDDAVVNDFINKVKKDNFGYGVYLGQKQYRGYIDGIKEYDTVEYLSESDEISSACSEDNLKDNTLDFYKEITIISDTMSLMFKKIDVVKKKVITDVYREPTNVKRVFFEKYGGCLKGKFYNCYKIDEKVITFM